MSGNSIDGAAEIGGWSDRTPNATQNPAVGFACLGDGSEAAK